MSVRFFEEKSILGGLRPELIIKLHILRFTYKDMAAKEFTDDFYSKWLRLSRFVAITNVREEFRSRPN